MEIEGEKVTTVLNVIFKRLNKEYNKKIYMIMNKKMIEYISDTTNILQVFCDTTYHALPCKSTHFKLWILVGFHKGIYKTVLLCISLIKNENEETFLKIFDYLKQRFKFEPKNITMDLCKAEINAARKIFPKTNIILCFFHYMQRIVKHLKELKSANKKLKEKAKDLLSNLKLKVFLEYEDIKHFYEKNKYKYAKDFKKFLKYYDKTFFNTNPYKNNFWCYYKIRNNLDGEIYFFTNNISESTNRSLNINYVGGCNTFFNFCKALNELILIFENKEVYNENKFSITRALNYYVINHKNIDLITNKKLIEIMKNYEDYLLKEKLPYKRLPDLDNFNYEIKNDDINLDNLQSDNYISNSSDDEEENNNIIDGNKNNYNSEDGGDDGNNDNSSENSDLNESNFNKKQTKAKSNKNNKSNKSNSHNNKSNCYANDNSCLKTLSLEKEKEYFINNIINNVFLKRDYLEDNIYRNNDNLERLLYQEKINLKIAKRKIWIRNKIKIYRLNLLNKFNHK